MEVNIRTIYEFTAAPGLPPEQQVDTDELNPPRFAELLAAPVVTKRIAASDVDIAIPIPAACALLLVADEPVKVRLASGETQMRVRMLMIAADDERGTALPAQSIRVSGNSSNEALVRIYHAELVT